MMPVSNSPCSTTGFRFGSTYFHNDITNLIQSVSDPVTFSSTNVNIGKAITEGTENFVAATITDRVRVRADYTFTRTVDATTGQELLAGGPRKNGVRMSSGIRSIR